MHQGDVHQRLESRKFKFEDPGFDPLARQSEGQFVLYPSESNIVEICLCLTTLPAYSRAACTPICAHVKDPIFICRKRVYVYHSRRYGHTQVLHTLG